ncbi:hypothetical protein MBLNU459_g7395t2 [Dothideomycetes sp. NU459]
MVLVRYYSAENDQTASLAACKTGDSGHNVVQLQYLAEGNANIIYKFAPLDKAKEPPLELQHKLLRLRKDKPFIQSTQDQYTAFAKHFAPLFRESNIVQHTLISLQQESLVALNADLHSLQASTARAALRHGDCLAQSEAYGTLMTDMTARPGETLIELKPKWLLQSPDAPQDSTRCRTCALRAQRSAAKAEGRITPALLGFCPLSLTEGTLEERQRAARHVVRLQMGQVPEHVEEAFLFLAYYLCNETLGV